VKSLALVFLDVYKLDSEEAQPIFRFPKRFFSLPAFSDIGHGNTAPLPALGIPPTDESHIKTFS
jgi:hypothetical protein